MRFIKGSVWSSGLIVTKAVSSLVVNKVVATQYGLNGITFLSHFQNFIALFLTIPMNGINVGVVKYLSDETMGNEERRVYFQAGLLLNGAVFLLSTLAIAFAGNYLTDLLSDEMKSVPWLLLLALSVLLQLFNFFFLATMLANGHLRTYVLLSGANAIILIASVGALAGYLPLSYLLLVVGLAPAILFPVSGYLALKGMGQHWTDLKLSAPKDALKNLGKFMIMALSMAVFGRAVDFIIREYSINEFNTHQTGMWQAVVRLSDLYTSAFIALIGMVYYPRVSRFINNPEELRKTVRSLFWPSAPVFALGLGAVYLLREPLLRLLFADEFTEADFLIDFQLIGDFLKLQSFWLAYLISAQARTRLFVISQFASAVVYVLLALWATDIFGLEGFTISHAIRYFLYLLFVMVLYRKLIK